MPIESFAYGAKEVELLRFAADIVIELRPDGRLVFVSPAAERIFDRPSSFFTDRSFLELIVPEDRQATVAVFRKVVDTGEEPLLRFRGIHREGRRLEFEATARSFINDEGRQRIVVVCRDLTAQLQQGAIDRTREVYHRAIAESGIRPAAIVSPDGTIHFSNRRFREVFGNHSNISEIRTKLNEEGSSFADAAWLHALSGENAGPGTFDFEYSQEDGSTFWFAATWEPVQLGDSRRQFTILCQDITHRKKVEHALRTIAQGIPSAQSGRFESTLAMIADTLEMDRIVLGLTNEEDPLRVETVVAWQDGEFLIDEVIALEGLPDLDVVHGEVCVHPTAVGELMPAVYESIGRDFNSYAGFPLRRTDGRVIGFVGGYGRKPMHDTDLTRSLLSSFATHAAATIDRRRADDEIHANQARFHALALQANEMLIEVDADSRITYMSPASQAILGRAPDSFIGLNVQSLTHPDDWPIVRTSAVKTSSGEKMVTAISRGRHADGSWRWLETRTTSFKGVDGTNRVLLMARDVTEQRRGELSRDLLFRVVQHGTDLVFVCEIDSTILFANESATGLLEIAIDGSAKQRFTELLDEADAELLMSEVLPNLAVNQPWSGELGLRGSSEHGSIVTEATIFMFTGSQTSVGTYLAITLRDITERLSAEEALRRSELQLSQAQKMEAVGRLAGGIAHDFNNLLTAIIGYSDLVLDQLGEGHGATRDAQEVLRAAERAGGLTRQLLAFSRRQVLQPKSIDLNAVVADIDRMMRRLIGENIELVTLQDGELNRIIADPGQIEQVIVNLVVNARDAMPTGGRIEVETANFYTAESLTTDSGKLMPGEYVVLKVSDTGIGMDAATRAQIFEPFFTTKDTYEGTGLGLASAYGIVSQSGGQIGVQSELGRGTTFSIYLPAALDQSKQVSPEKQERRTGGTETILLVEDSEPVRTLVARTLGLAGYTVLAAESGTAAMRYCSRHAGSIDLLLSDVVLPKSSGPEIASRAVELRPNMRVLFMSGFTDDTLIRHGLPRNSSALLEKPFAPSTVLTRVREILDAAQMPLNVTMFHGEHSQ